jgi:hypothetical protein
MKHLLKTKLLNFIHDLKQDYSQLLFKYFFYSYLLILIFDVLLPRFYIGEGTFADILYILLRFIYVFLSLWINITLVVAIFNHFNRKEEFTPSFFKQLTKKEVLRTTLFGVLLYWLSIGAFIFNWLPIILLQDTSTISNFDEVLSIELNKGKFFFPGFYVVMTVYAFLLNVAKD